MSYLVESNLLGVREFSIKDASLLASWMSTSAMDLFMISSSLTFPVQAETLIDYSKKIKPNEHNLYSVFLKETGQHIGHFEIKNINARHKIGTAAHIVLSPEYRRKGLGYHLINLISMVGFEVLGLYRISLSVHTVNVSAIAAYVKSGYIFEGLIREVLEFEGKRYSLYQMSLLRREWERNKSRSK